MKNDKLITDLEYIRNNAFCYISFHKADKKFKEICSLLPEKYQIKLKFDLLRCNPDYPDSGWLGAPVFEREMLAETIKEIIEYLKKGN